MEHSQKPNMESGEIDFSGLGFPPPSRVYSGSSLRASDNFVEVDIFSSLEISGFDLSRARFVRLGEDLVIVSGDASILIESYFSAKSPSNTRR